MKIIEKWGTFDKSADNYVFGVFNNRMTPEETYRIRLNTIRSINHYMKKLCERLKIDVPTTTYVARHSWATTLLRKGISTAYISKGFGHASFSTTEQYLGGFTQDQKKSVADLLTNLANG
jgi:integrase